MALSFPGGNPPGLCDAVGMDSLLCAKLLRTFCFFKRGASRFRLPVDLESNVGLVLFENGNGTPHAPTRSGSTLELQATCMAAIDH